MVPLVGVSSPAIILSRVVLPHPDGPTSTTIRGLGTVRLKSSTATTPAPKTFRTCEKMRSDMARKGYGRGERGAISKGSVRLFDIDAEGRQENDDPRKHQDATHREGCV